MKKQITVGTRTICSSNIPINKSRLIVTLSLLCFISIYSCVLFSATALAQSSDCQKFLGHVNYANREYVDYINMLNHVPDNAKNATAFDLLKPGEYKDTVDPYCRFSGCDISKIKAPGRAFQTQKVENAITLIKAIEDGQLATVKQYVPSSVNVNSIVPGGFTTVAFANPNEGTGGAKEWCTTTKVSPERKWSIGRSLLGVAIGYKHPEIADYLISVGADINLKDKNGSTPLMLAALHANLALVQKLLSSGADVRATDINGKTALHYAALSRNSDIFNKLIASGADINAKNLDGYTVLHFAANKGAVDIVKTILNTGFNVDAKNNEGRTALHYTTSADVLRMLIEAGANIDAKDKDGLTPLHLVAANDRVNLIQIYIDAEADIYAIDKYGKTPHNYAVKKGHQSALEVLYSHNTAEDDYTNFELFNIFVDRCYHRNDQTDEQIDEQRREKAKQLTIEYLKKNGYANKTDEKIMRTKAYADQFEIHYKSVIQNSGRSPQNIQTEYNACVKLSIQNFSDKQKLPIIYNYCKGSEIAWSGSIGGDAQSPDPIPPETILTSDEFSFKNCIESFAIYNDDYVTSKEYFLNRLQEDYNRFSKEAKKVRKDIAKAKKKSAEKQAAAAKKAQQNFIYWNSPRGKCESRCNQQYKKNTSMWNTCMDPCKDMRSDILDY